MNEKIQSVLNSLPHKPGIYIMKDGQGTILYVGKAISLYNRVRSYFQESTDLSPKNRSMVAKVEDIEFVVVKNEVEALVLESNYIKEYRPRSEEHTSELQSPCNLVCRLLLEKK